MKRYEVSVRTMDIHDTFEVEAVNEDEAELRAVEQFDLRYPSEPKSTQAEFYLEVRDA